MNNLRQKTKEYFPCMLFLAFSIFFWEWYVKSGYVSDYLVPAPSAVGQSFLNHFSILPEHILTTMSEALVGLFFAVIIGVLIAALIAGIPFIRRVLYPIVVVSQNIPILALAPLLAVWFGFGLTPKVIIVVLIGFFPIVVNTADGLMNVDKDMISLVRGLGANRWQTFRLVLFPSAIPAFFSGLRIASTYAVIGAVIAEWMGASSGLGLFLVRSQRSFQTDQIFMAIIVIAVLSISLFISIQILSNIAMPWRKALIDMGDK